MRDLINIISKTETPASTIYAAMSPLQRYRLMDKLPYIANHKGGWAARDAQSIAYIEANMDEFSHVLNPPVDDRDLGDGGIHRLY